MSRVGDREGGSYGSPETQEAACRAWAERNGCEVEDVVWDEDVSGATPVERRGLEALVRRVERNELAGVLTAFLDRFGRSVIEGALAYKRIVDAGGRLVCVSDGIDSNRPGDKTIFNVRMAFAEDYLDRVRHNWRSAVGRAAGRGVWVYKVPLGYRKLDDGSLEPDPNVGPLVAEAFRRRAAGARLPDLVERFRDADVETSVSGLQWIFKRRAYVGEMQVPGEVKGETRTIRGHHPPLVTEAEWEAANAARGTYFPRDGSAASRVKLAGLVYCATCRAKLQVGQSGKPGRRVPQYVCVNRDCTARANIQAAKLDGHVDRVLQLAALEREPHIGAVIEGDTRYADTLAAVDTAREEVETWRDEVSVSDVGVEGWKKGLQARQAKLDLARRALRTVPPVKSGRAETMTLRDFPPDPETGLAPPEVELEFERDAFRRFVARVDVRPTAGRVGRRIPPAHERTSVTFVGAEAPFEPPAAWFETPSELRVAA